MGRWFCAAHVGKRTDAEGSAESTEASPTPQQRAVIQRYLKLSDSRPRAPRLSVKSKPNQPLEVSQPSSADGAGLIGRRRGLGAGIRDNGSSGCEHSAQQPH